MVPILRLVVSIPRPGAGSELIIDNVAHVQPFPGQRLFAQMRAKMFSIGNEILARSKADIKASEDQKKLSSTKDLLSPLESEPVSRCLRGTASERC